MYLNESGINPVYMLGNIATKQPVFINKETEKYMKVEITRATTFINTSAKKVTDIYQNTETPIEIKNCTESDFDSNELMKENFRKFTGASLICVKNVSDLYLIGDSDSLDKTTFKLKISRCYDEPGEPKKCATEKEIDDFIDFVMVVKFH